MSDKLPGGKLYCFGLFHDTRQVGFICFANYVPQRKGTKKILHFNRLVIHPDFQGLNLGGAFVNETSRHMKRVYNVRVMGKFSAMPVFRMLRNDPNWKLLKTIRTFGQLQRGKGIRQSGFREAGIRAWSFEYFEAK